MREICFASQEDLEEARRISRRYSTQTIVGDLGQEQFDVLAKACIVNGIALIGKEDGQMVGLIAGQFIDCLKSGRVLEEVIWYVEPERRGIGVLLLDEFMKKAKEFGCSRVAMVAYKNEYFESVERVYLKKGFEEIERRYIKEI